MPEVVAPWALTKLQRIKDKIGMTTSTLDTLINRLISGATDYIESQTNRRFIETTYSNEVYSISNSQQDFLFLRQTPVSSLTALQYRAGIPSTPNWTNFTADQYELLEDGKSGIVKVYGGLSRGTNSVRASYIAGYKIDFNNVGNTALHNLPSDVVELCERLVIRWLKRRENAGKETESFDNASVTWKDLLDHEDNETINNYKRIPQFV